MRQVQHHIRHIAPDAFDHRGEGLVRNVHDLVDRGRCREKRQAVGCLGQEPLNDGIIGSFRRQKRVGNRLRRLLV